MIPNCEPAATTRSSVIQAAIFKAMIKLGNRKILNKTKEPQS
jgi:hypothetical protein